MPFTHRLCLLLATGFNLGRIPIASGTFGSLLGIPIVLAFALIPLHWAWQVPVCAALVACAVPVCDVAERILGKKDDGRIVADEYLTFPICMIGLPWPEHLWLLPVAFVVCRAMDIVKPFPAHRLQRLRGGLGITIDDVIASLYALGINWAIFGAYGAIA